MNRKPKCDCGHSQSDHYVQQGQCKRCACTWYYPNRKYILRKNGRKRKSLTDRKDLTR